MLSLRLLQRWLVVQSVLWLAALGYSAVGIARSGLTSAEIGLLGAAVVLSWSLLWALLRAGRTVADWVTLARFAALVATAAWAVLAGGVTGVIWTCLGLAVCADLLDGYCARRWGGSKAGAILDMESDQLVTLVLAVLACAVAEAPAWLLVLPALRYAYVLYVWMLGLPAYDPKPRGEESKRGKRICALTMAMLLVTLLPLATPTLRLVAGLVAVVALLYSFGSDAVFLAQERLGMRTTR